MSKIVLITGITSFLGRSLASYFISKGYIVFGIIRLKSSNAQVLKDIKGLNIIELDFANLSKDDLNILVSKEISKLISEIKSKTSDITFIHLGWGATLDRNNFMLQMLNIDYSKKVLEFAKTLNVDRFIFAGSQAEESDTAYGMAKREFANFAKKDLAGTGIRFIHLRIFSIYGPLDRDTSLLKTLVSSFRNNKKFDLSSCNYKWNFLYIDDFVKMILLLIEKDAKTGIYDIASDDTRLLKNYVLEAYKVMKAKNKLNFGKRADSLEKFAIPDISGTLKAIGDFKFTKFSEGIKNI